MDFKYIQVIFDKIRDKIDGFESIIFLSGSECVGKSYILEKTGKYYNYDRVILSLNPTSALQNLEYGVFLAALSKVGEYSNQALSVTTEIISEKNKTVGLASELLLNYKKNQLKYQLVSLSDIEIEILNRITLFCKKRKIMILADDVNQWDFESKKLLGKLIALQKDLERGFLPDMILILTSISAESLEINIGNCFHLEMECNLSYSSFSEEAGRLDLHNEKTIHDLYDITNGNIGLIANIKEYIDLSSLTGTDSLQKQLFRILENRITSSDIVSNEVISTLQTATVIGKEFNLIYLNKLLEQPLGVLDYHMKISCNEKFITKNDVENDFYFSTDTLYDFFVSKLNGRGTDYHYKFAKVLEKIAPYQFYLRYVHMSLSGNRAEAIPLLAIHCIRQCLDGCEPNKKSLDILSEYDNYWNVYENISISLKNYRNDNNYTKYFVLIESSDVCVNSMVNLEKDYVLCLLKYRTGSSSDHKEIAPILEEYFNEDTDFSQHIRIGILLFLLYCNRLGDYEKAKKIEKTLTIQIQHEVENCPDLMKECRIIERISPALYANEIAYKKTKRSLNYFEKAKENYGKEYIMSLTNYIGVGIYTIGVVMDSDVSWNSFYSKACEGLDFLNNSFSINIYGIPKLINNYILIGILSGNIQIEEGIELYNSLLSDEGHIPSKPLIICNQIILKFLKGDTTEILDSMQELFSNTDTHEYYRFIVGINYLNILITCNDYGSAEHIFNKLDYLIPAISIMDELYIKKHYDLLNKIISEKIIFSSVKEYCHYFSSSIHPANVSFPDVWKNPYVFSDLQYWSEY